MRWVVSVLAAILVTLTLFVLMRTLISVPGPQLAKPEGQGGIRFVTVAGSAGNGSAAPYVRKPLPAPPLAARQAPPARPPAEVSAAPGVAELPPSAAAMPELPRVKPGGRPSLGAYTKPPEKKHSPLPSAETLAKAVAEPEAERVPSRKGAGRKTAPVRKPARVVKKRPSAKGSRGRVAKRSAPPARRPARVAKKRPAFKRSKRMAAKRPAPPKRSRALAKAPRPPTRKGPASPRTPSGGTRTARTGMGSGQRSGGGPGATAGIPGRSAGGSGAGPRRASEEVVVLSRTAPKYPRRAARRGREGWVRIRFTITEKGGVADPKVIASKPRRVFDRAALKAIRKWRFKPKTIDGRAVSREAVQVIEFKLSG